MNEKSKKFALIGDMAGLLGFVSGCSGIACGILERYQAAVILLGGRSADAGGGYDRLSGHPAQDGAGHVQPVEGGQR